MVGEKDPAPGCQPLVVQRVGNRHQRRRGQQPAEQGLAAVPGGGDEEERQDEEQAFLVNHLGGVAQQQARQLETEARSDTLAQHVLHDQPQPADQQDQSQHLGQPGLAVDQHETGDTGEKSENGDHARMALHQRDDPEHESLAGGD